jgi:photosystem II stability/assembly factor-like uncharacterized protein
LNCFFIFFFTLVLIGDGVGQWVRTNGPNALSLTSIGDNLFAGFGGVSLTSDAGDNWKSINQGLNYGGSVQSIWANKGILFVGTEYSGVFSSTDKGTSWTLDSNGLSSHAEITCFAGNDENIFVGTFDSGGVFISSNDGASWKSCSSELALSAVTSLLVSGTNIFAGVRTRGIFLSTNNGINWKAINSGISFDSIKYKNTTILVYPVISSLAISDKTLYAGTDSGVFISSDSEAKWTKLNTGMNANKVYCILVYDGKILAGTDAGVFLLSKDKKNWSPINSGFPKASAAYSLLIQDIYLFAANDYSVYRFPASELIGNSSVEIIQKSEFSLKSFPNPLTTQTTISFSNEQRKFVSATIFDLLGKQCSQLFSGELEAGNNSFEWDASHNPPGMYLCVVRANGVVKEIPMMVVR